jgi:hypothetical protein
VTERWMRDLLAAVDRMDVPAFVAGFTEDGEFRFGNWPAARGHEAVGAFTRGFLDTLSAIRHQVVAVWSAGEQLFTEGEVTYTRKDGRQVTVPFLTRAELAGGRMRLYRVFADPSPLFA